MRTQGELHVNYAVTRNIWGYQKLEEAGQDPSSTGFRGSQHLDFRLNPPELGDNRFPLF